MPNPSERLFEDEIAAWLTEYGGYAAVKNDVAQADQPDFDAAAGLDTAELATFIGATQAEEWAELIRRYGGDQPTTQRRFAERLSTELDRRGVVDVLRHGVVDHGVTLRPAYFKPAHGLSDDLVAKYAANRLTVTRQLRYATDSTKAIDLALLVNGIVVATAELKNPLTGQDVEHAMTQYRTDRDPANRTLARAVVHFAVDPIRVAMTTRLAGTQTRFLPFNLGHNLGPGNPPNPDGHATAYLWEQVWQRDAWLDLLGRFVHVEKTSRGSKKPATVIFPRYHQWDAVRSLESAAAQEGPGASYLVQHSAGSGKSNTIAWLAHRLSTLHRDDEKVFDKVVVITDRVVLDRQLQDTIYQFEHAHGLVERIDRDSQQLAEALAGQRARIIITTLQKFPFVLDKVEELPKRTYAVIIDEAHSSQTGEAAKELRRVLGASAVDTAESDVPSDELSAMLADAVRARGRQQNISFFAFTATPKGRTLELFGRYDPATSKHDPFHLYSMRQAIEEKFIHDVLASYTTYQTYFHIEKAIIGDPAYQTAKARQAIARFVTLHEHNLSQKAEVVIENFRQHISGEVAGRAKAMVVCSSRAHAVRFFQALRDYVRDHGYDLGVLVAFSGVVEVNGDPPVTEAHCNGFPDTETAARFDTDAYRIMVVAEKFQTGFDQPKLYAMYVDKTLTGLAAVQTLSRLNRTHPDKDGTFVLDFVNDAHSIADEFDQYHGMTVAPPSDPNLLYDTRRDLDEFGVLEGGEVTTFAQLLLAEKADHGRLHATLGPAIDRFDALDDDEQGHFRDALSRFVRIYSFLSQIVTFGDIDLERDYIFGRALSPFIKADPGESIDLSGTVELTHLRHEEQFSGSVALRSDQGEVATIYSGTGRSTDPEPEPLSAIIDRINAAYGTDWRDADLLVLDAALRDVVDDRDVQATAFNSSDDNFRAVFPGLYQDALVGRVDRDEKVVFRYLDDEDLRDDINKTYATLALAQARVAYQAHCPVGELLTKGEGSHLEYKSTLRTGVGTDEVMKVLETAVVKSIAAFANSADGGTLLIGVADDGSVHGLASDYASLHREGKDDRDVLELHLSQLMINAIGTTAASTLDIQSHTVDGKDLCRVHVPPSAFPVDAQVVLVDRSGQHSKGSKFFVRVANSTRAIDDEDERQRYVLTRWRQQSG